MTLVEALARYERHLARRPLTDNTRKAFIGDVHIFIRHLQPDRAVGTGEGGAGTAGMAGMAVTRVTPDHIKAFLADLERGDVAPSPKSIERRLTSLKVFFKWLQDAGYTALNPADGVAYRPFVDPLPEYLSEEQAGAVVDAARGLATSAKLELRPLTAILLVLDTGIKKGECLALSVQDVSFNEPGGARVWVRYAKPRLQFKDRKLFIGDECAEVVRTHVERYGCEDKLFDCTGRNLEYLFNRKIAPDAGVQALTFEMLRWTCAVRDYTANVLNADQMQVKYGLSPIGWSEMQAKLERLVRQRL